VRVPDLSAELEGPEPIAEVLLLSCARRGLQIQLRPFSN
jgi:hypothetical protein